jgi:two-component system, LytTR family, sensor kinase
VVSALVSVCGPGTLGVLCRVIVFNLSPPAPADLLSPVWLHLVTYRAIADISMYWMILAAAFALQAHDDNQARRRQAADLERALVSAQVDALRMKLQPHFLFNTLNAISVLAVEKNAGAVVTTVERLVGLLRSSIDANGRQMVTVAEELAWLEQYLAIQETRFGDRLRIVRRIDPAARRALVPSLILQPLIENAVKHGFSRLLDARCLTIAICRDREALQLSVADDGPGLPPGWDLATHCGRGLKNVVERLDALYAGVAALTLTDAPGRGTLATVRLPWRETTPAFSSTPMPASG